MSSFKHNPYQQFPPQQSSPTLSARGAAPQEKPPQQPLQQQHQALPHQHETQTQQQNQQQQEAPQRPPQPHTIRPGPHSPLSPDASGSLSSFNSASFTTSREVSSNMGGSARIHNEMTLPATVPLPNPARATLTSSNVHLQRTWYPSRSLLPTSPGAMPRFTPTSVQLTSPHAQQSLPRQHSDTASSVQESSSFSGFAAPHTETNTPMDFGYHPYVGDASDAPAAWRDTIIATTTGVAPPRPSAAPTTTRRHTATLFVDGLPPSIENQYQLTPYVPPHGRVEVRVKRSNGRDVGFIEYDSVASASAALEWFRDIRMMKEIVQNSVYDGFPEGHCEGCGGPAYHTYPQSTYRAPTTEDPLAWSSHTNWTPVAYEDYLDTCADPNQFYPLLRQSISLRVEWARSQETQHSPTPFMPSSYPARQLTEGGSVEGPMPPHDLPPPQTATSANTFSHQLSSVQQQPTSLQSNSQAYHPPPPPPPPSKWFPSPSQQLAYDPQRLRTEEFSSTASFTTVSPSRSLSDGRPGPAFSMEHVQDTSGVAVAFQPADFSAGPAEYRCQLHKQIAMSYSRLRKVAPSTTSINAVGTRQASTSPPASDPPHKPAKHKRKRQPPPRAPKDSSLSSSTLFLQLRYNTQLPPYLTQVLQSTKRWLPHRAGANVPLCTSGCGGRRAVLHGVRPASISEDHPYFAVAQQVCCEEFFAERFTGFMSFTPYLQPPYCGGCFVTFRRHADMRRCLWRMRADAGLMKVFVIEVAHTNSYKR